MGRSIEITPELLAGFLDEAPEYLEMLDAGLMELEAKAADGALTLEAEDDRERMNSMFRAAHSLKGLAAAFGFDKIKELTHRMETLFDKVRMRQRDLTVDGFEALFGVFDRLRLLVKELSDASAGPVDISDSLAALDRILGVESVAGSSAGASSAPAVQPPQTLTDVLAAPALVSLFIETTGEAIDELSEGLLALESGPLDAERLNQVFRSAHNIKGASGAAGLVALNHTTHDMETVLDHVRSGALTIDEQLSSALLRTVDVIREMVDAVRAGDLARADRAPTEALLAPWITRRNASSRLPANPVATKSTPAPTTAIPATTEGDGPTTWTLSVTFAPNFAEAGIQAYLIFNKLNDIALVTNVEPSIESLSGDSTLDTVRFTVETTTDINSIKSIVATYAVASVEVTQLVTAPPTVSAQPGTKTPPRADASSSDASRAQAERAAITTVRPSAPPAPKPTSGPPTSADPRQSGNVDSSSESKSDATTAKAAETLRVDQEKLNHLMNLGGELVINRARFAQISGRLRSLFDGKDLGFLVNDMDERLMRVCNRLSTDLGDRSADRGGDELERQLGRIREDLAPMRGIAERMRMMRASMHDFDEALHSLTRVSDGIQKEIMSTRMVPIGPTFNRFKRVVRDIAKSSGKQIDLVLKGEATELDKRMIDELADPLTHMVRNSVDHGLEMPDVRAANGKPPIGTVTLEASHCGNSICIEVRDDGAGINLERVKAKALEKGLTTEAQLAKLTDREIAQFIMQPGFSTAAVVTELSGRGMGMDIVKSKIEKLSGTVDIDSVTGQGARITIKLPLTLAIITSMVARIGKGVYAVPLECVAEIIQVDRSEIQYVQKRSVVVVRKRAIPVVAFEEVFQTASPSMHTATRDDAQLKLMIVNVNNDQLGLVVDELLGQEVVVIKSIAENYRNIRGIAGASIRGDGTVSLILDVGTLIEQAGRIADRGATQGVETLVGA